MEEEERLGKREKNFHGDGERLERGKLTDSIGRWGEMEEERTFD